MPNESERLFWKPSPFMLAHYKAKLKLKFEL
jgi:hypothetical protein